MKENEIEKHRSGFTIKTKNKQVKNNKQTYVISTLRLLAHNDKDPNRFLQPPQPRRQ